MSNNCLHSAGKANCPSDMQKQVRHTSGLALALLHVRPDLQGLLPGAPLGSCSHGCCVGMNGGSHVGAWGSILHELVSLKGPGGVALAGAHLNKGGCHPAVWLTAVLKGLIPDLPEQQKIETMQVTQISATAPPSGPHPGPAMSNRGGDAMQT